MLSLLSENLKSMIRGGFYYAAGALTAVGVQVGPEVWDVWVTSNTEVVSAAALVLLSAIWSLRTNVKLLGK